MDETIDYPGVIAQLQLENEMLRSNMKTFTEVRNTVYKIPNMLEQCWHNVVANKYHVLVGLMLVYWAVSIALMLWDRFK